ncbi:A disintegrin and metalloproteinase with thrombospondin motifs 20 [Chelonia mydas]|uniref:A disintegrin and metalloproteinase with thrombospondin motifs 20 n=1 Tax=Chelonia mydas TaxID=8469 RepID=M7BEF3_CHEMY|nr:A disintegrin and metalloproteinase with thrombospondin motifs 20 [Chelonia mydas]
MPLLELVPLRLCSIRAGTGLAELGTMCDPLRSCSISEENGLSAAFTIAHELGHVTGYGECLLDKPSGRIYDLSSQLPGSMYDVNKQCELMFGPGSQVCPYLKQCKRLWCTSAEGIHKGCRTQHMPLADGTECGLGMGKQDFREQQCSDFNGKHFNINGLTSAVRWLPKYSGISMKDRCKLFCRVSGTTSYYQLKDRVADGTPCGTETNDICVQGLCRCSRSCERGIRMREAFCMNNFGRRLADRECHELPRIVTQNCNEFLCPNWATSDWTDKFNVTTLQCPVTCGKGMRHRQVWCQLNDEKLRENFCNPNSRPESVRSCELHECASWQVGPWGSCAVTCGRGYQMRAVKCVTGTYGVILEDDRECNAATRPRDSQCSASCGKGNRARYVSCRDAYGGVADESLCTHLPRPAEISNCFSPCGEWQAGNWSPCTVTCDNGIATRQVVCVNYHQQIDENYCDPESRPSKEQECNMPPCLPVYRHIPKMHDHPSHFPELDYPPIHRGHHPQDNVNQWSHPSVGGNQWRTGPWGACSSTCAGGFQRRVVVCQDVDGISASYCDEATKPPESRRCDSGHCPRWNYGSWGECTHTCGDGIKTRLVICQLPNGQMLNDQSCEILDKPPNMAQCNVRSCPGDVSWQRGPWKSKKPGGRRLTLGTAPSRAGHEACFTTKAPDQLLPSDLVNEAAAHSSAGVFPLLLFQKPQTHYTQNAGCQPYMVVALPRLITPFAPNRNTVVWDLCRPKSFQSFPKDWGLPCTRDPINLLAQEEGPESV